MIHSPYVRKPVSVQRTMGLVLLALVPGIVAHVVFVGAGVLVNLAISTLTAVAEGDAAAGIVYVTDARAAGDAVAAVAIPEERNAVATYPIGVLAGSGHLDVARAFAEYVLGDEAQAVLKEHGFLPPS